MIAEMIATRATKASNLKFYKSYIKEVKLAEVRMIPGHKARWREEDYYFKYKGKQYRINEHIKPNENGEIIYSASWNYELQNI